MLPTSRKVFRIKKSMFNYCYFHEPSARIMVNLHRWQSHFPNCTVYSSTAKSLCWSWRFSLLLSSLFYSVSVWEFFDAASCMLICGERQLLNYCHFARHGSSRVRSLSRIQVEQELLQKVNVNNQAVCSLVVSESSHDLLLLHGVLWLYVWPMITTINLNSL